MADVQGVPYALPENDVVVLEIVDTNTRINKWEEYSFSSNFLIPTDAFSFTISADALNQSDLRAIVPGAEVKLTVNGAIQGNARIDKVTYTADRENGSQVHIEGRDKLAYLIDSGIDPIVKFNPQMTLLELLAEVFGPFGFTQSSFEVDDSANRGVQSRNVRGTKTSKGAKTAGRALQSYILRQLRPYPNEHAFEFAARVCQRFGLWLWLSADGKKVFANKPNYDQETIYSLIRLYSGEGNNFNGSVALDVSEQPSIILADGFSGGVDYGRSRLRAHIENPLLDVDNSAALNKYAKSGSKKAEIPLVVHKLKMPHARPLFLHDDDAKTPEQLEAFVLREMSLRLRKSLEVRATVEGHQQNGNIWTVNTVCSFSDDISRVREPLWILERTFSKSRRDGTTTNLVLIRRHSLTF